MDRANLEKYHDDPAWRAAFEDALAEAEKTGLDRDHYDAQTHAAVAADLALAEAEGAEARREADLEATRARIASFEAEQAAQAEAKPDPDEQAKAALKRAVANLNARRGHTDDLAAPDGGKTSSGAEVPDDESADPAPAQSATGGSPWAAVVARVNQGR